MKLYELCLFSVETIIKIYENAPVSDLPQYKSMGKKTPTERLTDRQDQ